MSTEETTAIINTNFTFSLNGLVNAAPVGLQSPTISIPQLPFGPWGSLSTARNVSGRIIGMADPDQYQVGLFAAQSNSQFLGGKDWRTPVAADGSFSLSVPQSAGAYVALLMTPEFANQYYSATFPSGDGTVTSLPSPAEQPGQVVMEVEIPAALNRYLGLVYRGSTLSSFPPGGALTTPQTLYLRSNEVARGDVNPTNPNTYEILWNILVSYNSRSTFEVYGMSSEQVRTGGLLLISLYIYGNSVYLIVGARRQSSAIQLASAALVNWSAFPPSSIQVGVAVTVLPASLLVAVDHLDVEASAIRDLIKALEVVGRTMVQLLFSF
jgi:hypothetical protein